MSREDRKGVTDALRLEELTRENDALRAGNAERDARIAALTEELALHKAVADAPKPVGDEVFVLKTKLMLNDRMYPKGAELPFDPRNPPEGCNGFIEGKHYERARVIVRHAN